MTAPYDIATLVTDLGPVLVSQMACSSPVEVVTWVEGRRQPDPGQAVRLQAASDAWHLVVAVAGPDEARQWFTRWHEVLGCPAEGIRAGLLATTMAAAQEYVAA